MQTIPEGIRELIDDGSIVEIIAQLKSGKEATVFTCRANPRVLGRDLVAVKVFREHASARSNHRYLDGSEVLDARAARAMRAGSRFGRAVARGVWHAQEHARLLQMHRAGVSVPEPIFGTSRAIVMELIGDETRPAPRLHDVGLGGLDPVESWSRLRHDIELMLGADLIHGDLSPYNLLVWEGRIRVIDVPQAVDPRRHPDPWPILLRDVHRAAEPFIGAGVAIEPDDLFIELRSRWQRASL